MRVPRTCWTATLLMIRLALGGMFITVGLSKLMSPPDAFSRAILSYDLVSPMAASLAALYLPWLELAAGLCVLVGWSGRGGAMVLSSLIALFTVVKLSSVVRGLTISECGCYGSELAWLELADWRGILLNLLWLVLCFVLVVADVGPWSIRASILARISHPPGK